MIEEPSNTLLKKISHIDGERVPHAVFIRRLVSHTVLYRVTKYKHVEAIDPSDTDRICHCGSNVATTVRRYKEADDNIALAYKTVRRVIPRSVFAGGISSGRVKEAVVALESAFATYLCTTAESATA